MRIELGLSAVVLAALMACNEASRPATIVGAGDTCNRDDVECGPRLICRNDVCRDVCLGHLDCPPLQRCHDTACLPATIDELVCGDGVVDLGEDCDDGNGVATDECTDDCTIAECGDGVRRDDITDPGNAAYEACDDGNADQTDGCLITCEVSTCVGQAAFAYIDGDGDGVGAGLPVCAPLPLTLGYAMITGDCNDNDGTVTAVRAAYPDGDGDGVTGAPVELCVDDLPSGYSAIPVAPPRSSLRAGAASSEFADGVSRSWFILPGALAQPDGGAGECANIRDDRPSESLVVKALGLSIPVDAEILGMRVHVLRRQREATPSLHDLSVKLVVDGVVVGEERADLVTLWSSTATEAIYGGPADQWGITLTAQQANSSELGVALRVVNSGSSSIDAFVDYVWVDVFYSDAVNDTLVDCNDASATLWLATSVYVDADGDGYTVGEALESCVGIDGGLFAPALYVPQTLGEDCYDAHDGAFPGQTACFTTHRGDGTFDYDCDDLPTPCGATLITACACTTSCGIASSTVVTPIAACGAANTGWTTCSPYGATCPGACAVAAATYTTRCR